MLLLYICNKKIYNKIFGMHKIPNYLENPIDNFIYIIVEFLAPYCHMLHLSPNFITTLSIFSGILSAICIIFYYFKLSALFYFLAYIFDCLDGYVARKYNMVTKFGDIYDHVGDMLKVILIIIAFCYINSNLFIYFLPILLYVLCVGCIHLGCQENYYKLDESAWLNILKRVYKPKDDEDLQYKMGYTKYFGFGTFTVCLIIIMLVYGDYYSVTENTIKIELDNNIKEELFVKTSDTT
jgi:phosphatidylglycerophosphate synthase